MLTSTPSNGNTWSTTQVCAPTRVSASSMPKLPLRLVVIVPDRQRTWCKPFRFVSKRKISPKSKLERVFSPTVSHMGALLDTKIVLSTVLYFMGHCVQDQEDDSRGLVFEHGETVNPEYISASRLIGLVKDVRLVFLSACDSRGVTRVLAERGVWCIGSNCPSQMTSPTNSISSFAIVYSVEIAMNQARSSYGDVALLLGMKEITHVNSFFNTLSTFKQFKPTIVLFPWAANIIYS